MTTVLLYCTYCTLFKQFIELGGVVIIRCNLIVLQCPPLQWTDFLKFDRLAMPPRHWTDLLKFDRLEMPTSALN